MRQYRQEHNEQQQQQQQHTQLWKQNKFDETHENVNEHDLIHGSEYVNEHI